MIYASAGAALSLDVFLRASCAKRQQYNAPDCPAARFSTSKKHFQSAVICVFGTAFV